MKRVGAVLLASGLGRRFGSNKLLRLVEGVPLYRRAMTTLAGAGLDRLAVCSPYQEVLEAGEELGFLQKGSPPPSAWGSPGWRTWMGCSSRCATSLF